MRGGNYGTGPPQDDAGVSSADNYVALSRGPSSRDVRPARQFECHKGRRAICFTNVAPREQLLKYSSDTWRCGFGSMVKLPHQFEILKVPSGAR